MQIHNNPRSLRPGDSQHPVWPTLGNHEGASTTSGTCTPLGCTAGSSGPYYEAFVLPAGAQAGGVASGTEAYYSFNYGNAHFISLNSYEVSRSPSGPMATWLTADLAANAAQWTIAYWHHPPYSKGTHNSDSEVELIEMRENILPILEAAGVDVVLSGHSHIYERSFLIDAFYATPTTVPGDGDIVDAGDGRAQRRLEDRGLSVKRRNRLRRCRPRRPGDGGSGNHPVMYFSETANGSVLMVSPASCAAQRAGRRTITDSS
jgi:hypothetical protein